MMARGGDARSHYDGRAMMGDAGKMAGRWRLGDGR
jgi:hypothetical protein